VTTLRTLALALLLGEVWVTGVACQNRSRALDTLRVAAPDVVWDTSAVNADINGDGVADFAHLGRARGRVYVGLVLAGSKTIDMLDFAVSSAIQEAICSEPAALSAEATNYPLEEIGPLEGFRPSTRASGLRLAGGECDSIHLYWDHDHNRLGWWRL
jgi:hypothetical protein